MIRTMLPIVIVEGGRLNWYPPFRPNRLSSSPRVFKSSRIASRNFNGIDSSRASVLISIGPSRYFRPKAIMAFSPYCVLLEIVRIA
jgi:hypothetical protein